MYSTSTCCHGCPSVSTTAYLFRYFHRSTLDRRPFGEQWTMHIFVKPSSTRRTSAVVWSVFVCQLFTDERRVSSWLIKASRTCNSFSAAVDDDDDDDADAAGVTRAAVNMTSSCICAKSAIDELVFVSSFKKCQSLSLTIVRWRYLGWRKGGGRRGGTTNS